MNLFVMIMMLTHANGQYIPSIVDMLPERAIDALQISNRTMDVISFQLEYEYDDLPNLQSSKMAIHEAINDQEHDNLFIYLEETRRALNELREEFKIQKTNQAVIIHNMRILQAHSCICFLIILTYAIAHLCCLSCSRKPKPRRYVVAEPMSTVDVKKSSGHVDM